MISLFPVSSIVFFFHHYITKFLARVWKSKKTGNHLPFCITSQVFEYVAICPLQHVSPLHEIFPFCRFLLPNLPCTNSSMTVMSNIFVSSLVIWHKAPKFKIHVWLVKMNNDYLSMIYIIPISLVEGNRAACKFWSWHHQWNSLYFSLLLVCYLPL